MKLMMKLKERVFLFICTGAMLLIVGKFNQFRIESSNKLIATREIHDTEEGNHVESLDDHQHQLLTPLNDEPESKSAQKQAERGVFKSKPSLGEQSPVSSFNNPTDNPMHGWDIWADMVSDRKITSDNDRDVKKILRSMRTAKVVEARVGYKGTQLKSLLTLGGPSQQAVVFKPGRYSRNHIIEGAPYEGFDRHNGEIAAFHLDRVLGFNRAPPVVGRYVDLEKEIRSVAEAKLAKTFFADKNKNLCFFGVCHYCNKEEAACTNSKGVMEGSLTIWMPNKWQIGKMRHPYQRTYRKDKKAVWEKDEDYCANVVMLKKPYDSGSRLLDIMDTAIFDYLIGNADRHHYEYLGTDPMNGMIIHLDNAKSFGNPTKDYESILAPLKQCCRLRNSTHARLKGVAHSTLTLSTRLARSMSIDPLSPVLTQAHLKAVDRRLGKTLLAVEKCLMENDPQEVLKDDSEFLEILHMF